MVKVSKVTMTGKKPETTANRVAKACYLASEINENGELIKAKSFRMSIESIGRFYQKDTGGIYFGIKAKILDSVKGEKFELDENGEFVEVLNDDMEKEFKTLKDQQLKDIVFTIPCKTNLEASKENLKDEKWIEDSKETEIFLHGASTGTPVVYAIFRNSGELGKNATKEVQSLTTTLNEIEAAADNIAEIKVVAKKRKYNSVYYQFVEEGAE